MGTQKGPQSGEALLRYEPQSAIPIYSMDIEGGRQGICELNSLKVIMKGTTIGLIKGILAV